MKKKDLPFHNSHAIITECWNYYKLELLLLEQNNMPWYIENFMMVQVFESFVSYYNDVNSQDWASPNYDMFFEYDDQYNMEDIVSSIFDAIDNGGYPILYLDLNIAIEKKTFHEVLIYGYDKDNYEAKIVIWKNNGWRFENIDLGILVKAFESGKKHIEKNVEKKIVFSTLHYPYTVIYVKKQSLKRVNLARIYRTIKLMLHSCNCGVTGNQIYPGDKAYIWLNSYRGVGVYKVFFDSLYHKLIQEPDLLKNYKHPLISMKKIQESKEGLIFRLSYLFQNGYLERDDAIINQCEYLLNITSTALRAVEKYMISHNVKYLDYMSDNYKMAGTVESLILNQILLKIEKKYRDEICN